MAEDFGGGAVDTAVDVSVVDAGSESTALVPAGDTGLTTTEEGQGETQVTQTGDRTPARTTPRNWSEALAPIREDKTTYNRAMQAIGIQGKLTKELGPRPFDAIKTLRQVYSTVQDQWGGVEEIGRTFNEMERYDNLFLNGDPELINQMTETPKGKAAMAKLMPAVLAKVAELDPYAYTQSVMQSFEGLQTIDKNAWTGYMAGVFLRHLQSNNIDMVVQRMASMLPADNDGAKQLAGEFDKFVTALAQMAQLQPKPKPAEPVADPRIAEMEQQVQNERQEREKMELQQWKQESAGLYRNALMRQIAATTAGKTITDAQRKRIEQLVGQDHAVGAMGAYNNAQNTFWSNKDKNGYLTSAKSFYEKNMPNWVKAAVRDLGIRPTAAATKPAAGSTTQPVTQRTSQAQPGSDKWMKGPIPKTEEIKLGDPRNDIRKGRAVLKNGTLREWAVPTWPGA